MITDPVSKLTEGQRACLRRVLLHMSSKDIARELDISPHTVDQRLRVAIQTLGVSSRFEAARLLAQHERPDLYQAPVYQTPHVAPTPRHPIMGSSGSHEDRRYGQAYGADQLREEQVAFQATPWHFAPPLRLPMPMVGGDRNDLGTLPRVAWIGGIAIGTALSFGALIAGLDALSRLL